MNRTGGAGGIEVLVHRTAQELDVGGAAHDGRGVVVGLRPVGLLRVVEGIVFVSANGSTAGVSAVGGV